MCCDQPVSWSGCGYLSRDWVRRVQLPHQVLTGLLALFLLPASAGAEDEKYYTWIDADGRVHNTPVSQTPDKSKNKSIADSPPGDDDTYLTEEQVDQKIEDYDRDNPAFYIWMDGEGRVQTQTFDPEAEENAAVSGNDSGVAVSDHILAPPFRLPEEVTAAACCEAYADQFEPIEREFKSLEMFSPGRYRPFYTRQGNRLAWYFRTGAVSYEGFSQRFLAIRIRGADIRPTLIALNASYEPLYQVPELTMHYIPETWRSVEYLETLILIEDPDVAAFILYPDMTPSDELSVEIRWANGESPF